MRAGGVGMSRYKTIKCEADVNIFELCCELSDDEKPLREQVRLLGHAIERCDEPTAADLLHRICFDFAGVPVINRLNISPLQAAA